MKAAVVNSYGDSEVLQINEVEVPVPDPQQVLIKAFTTSVNFIDILSRRGVNGYGRALPFIPGREVAGIIEAVGEEVSDLKVGQRVMALSSSGSYAEKVVADASKTFPISESIDFDDAGGILMVGITAYNILVKVAHIKPGDCVLIHAAAGGVGLIATQLARLLGASKIIGIVGKNEKIQSVKDAGAHEVINYNEVHFAEKVLEITGGKGADIILDSIAGETFELGMTCLADRGRMVIYSHASGKTGSITTMLLNSRGCSVHGYSLKNESPYEIQKTVSDLLDMIESKKIHFIIDKKFPLSQANEAHQWVEGRQSIGKTLIKVI
jgi:NADPH:quinone reductase